MRLALNGYDGGFRIGGRLVTNLRYADDIVLIASTCEELQKLVSRVDNATVSVGMRLDVKKTETMGVSDDESPITVKVGSGTLREVHSFNTLVQGSVLKRRVSRK